MSNPKVDFLNLIAQYHKISTEIDHALQTVLRRQIFILGEEVSHFEAELAQYLGSKYVVTVNSGTDALIISLRALGIGKGDEVITQPNSFIATTLAITEVGATPVFVDIDLDTLQIDSAKIESAITNRTKAILPVHLFGAPCKIDSILRVAKKHKLFVIEDAAQAIGATYQDKKLGTYGDVGIFSFYPGKNLGAYGDGGAISTDSYTLYKELTLLRNYGQEKKYFHASVGINSRLDEIQAAILRVKLKHIDVWNQKRATYAKYYDKGFRNVGEDNITVLKVCAHGVSNYHLYPIRVSERVRDNLMEFLKGHEIQTLVHYPVPIHMQECYQSFGWKEGDFPITEKVTRELISLPIYSELRIKQLKHVIDTTSSYFNHG